MKDKVKTIEGIVWPISDVSSFNGQKNHLHIHEDIMHRVPNRSVLVQAGGNCGMVLNTLVPYFTTVYTFEPDPVNFYCLNQNVTDPRVIKLQGCVGNDTTPVRMQLLENRPEDIGSFYVNGEGITPVFRIDDLHLPDCGLIFLDVEGYEYEALQGSLRTIQQYKPMIFFEVCRPWLERYSTTPEDVSSFLTSIGYAKLATVGSGGRTDNELWGYVETDA